MVTVDFNRFSLLPGDRVLDIGCGSGRHTAAAYQYPGISVIGVDLNLDDVQQARNRLLFHDHCGEHGGGSWLLSVADIGSLPFEDASFDLVICSEVLEHILDEKTAVTEIIRVLKTGRTLVVSVPRYFPERICWTLSDAYHQTANGHVRIYRKQQLIRLLEAQGVIFQFSHFAHSIHSPYWWLKCLVGPERTDAAFVNGYHRFLTWDILNKPRFTRILDALFNPLFGKSLVVYCKKRQ
jgi:ubiquinone/menaquinone biosynthesis C-methylase UbiE